MSEEKKFDLGQIIEKIKSNQISELDLSHQNLGDEKAIRLADALEENTSLKKLDLFGNNITSSGAEAIIKSIRSVKRLDLSVNKIDKIGCLGEYVAKNKVLKKLYLDPCPDDYNPIPKYVMGERNLFLLGLYQHKNTVLQMVDIVEAPRLFERNAKYNKLRKTIFYVKESLTQPDDEYTSCQQELFEEINKAKEDCEALVSNEEYGADEILHQVYGTLALIYERNKQHKDLLELYVSYFLKHPEFNSDDVSLALSNTILDNDDWLKSKEKWTIMILLLKDSKDEKLKGLVTRCYTALKKDSKVLPSSGEKLVLLPENDQEIASALELDASPDIELTYLLTKLMKKICRVENKVEQNEGFRATSSYSPAMYTPASKRKREENDTNNAEEPEKKKFKPAIEPMIKKV